MMKAFRYRLYPSKAQQSRMVNILSECRWLYNHFLAQRKTEWEQNKKSVGLYEQHNSLIALKQQRPFLKGVYSQALQEVGMRLDLAFKAFFRRVKAGEKPGYPRFRGKGWYNSFTHPQNNGSFRLEGDKLHLSKVGDIPIVLHRQIEGVVKRLTISRTATGKWYATFISDVEPEQLPKNDDTVGIDLGVSSFATLSTGETVPNPRFFKQDEQALAQVQRRKSKTPSDKNRHSAALVHERIGNRRKDFCHQTSRRLVDAYGVLCVEDLNTKKMLVNGKPFKLSKSIADVAWRTFVEHLCFKAESAGRTVVKVNPAYTSQTCSSCGAIHKLSLAEREFRCSDCGLVLGRDLNAARNILSVGLHTLASA